MVRNIASLKRSFKAPVSSGRVLDEARPRRLLRAFRDDRQGTAMIVFAAALPVLLLAGGGAVDVQRATGAHAQLQRAADSAALASAVHDGTEGEKEAVALSFLEANADPSLNDLELAGYSYDSDTGVHALSATAAVGTFFLGAVGIDDLNIAVEAEVTYDLPQTEIALVLDVSSSMGDGTRFADAQAAALALIDGIYTDTRMAGKVKMSVVPYGGFVNLDPADAAGIAVPPANSSDAAFRAAEGFCPVERGGTLSVSLAPPSSGRSPGAYYKQDSWGWTSECEYTPETLPLSNDPVALRGAINQLRLERNTNLIEGLLWGARTLDSAWNSAWTGLDAAADGDAIKAIVLMTDGEPGWYQDANGIWLDQAAYDAACTLVGSRFRVFGVAFEAEPEDKTSMQRCMSLAGGDYRDADGEDELTQAFVDITRSLMSLRLSK